MDTITLVAAGGLSLTVPDSFTEVPDEESPQQPLVAAVDDEGDPGGFRPTISVQVDELSPELASIAELSTATVARQIALDRHVVSVDVLPVEGEADGRWVTSVSPQYGTTVLDLQYLTIRAARAVTLSVRVKASTVDPGIALFRYLTRTLVYDGLPSGFTPAASVAPVMAASGAPAQPALEPLGDIGPRQRFSSACPPLASADLAALKYIVSRRRRGRDGLLNAGLVDGDGRLTGAGMIARDLLLSARARLTAGLTPSGGEGRRVLQVLATGSDVVVIADAPPGAPSPGQTVDVVPSLTLAARLVRWLGVAPAWTAEIGDAGASTVRVGAEVWNARLAHADAPAPSNASAGLLALWEQPWQLATVRTTKRFRNGPRSLQFIKTPEAGCAGFSIDSASGSVVLRARPSAQLLRDLLIISGAVAPPGSAAPRSEL